MQNRVKELREEKGITQTQLAKMVGVVRSAMCQYENGSRQIPDVTKIALADFFEVTIDYLLGYSNIKKQGSEKRSETLLKMAMESKEPISQATKDKMAAHGLTPDYLDRLTEDQKMAILTIIASFLDSNGGK